MFRWHQFLAGARIEFTQLSSEELGVRCPFCGAADSGERPNLSINIKGHGWKCWGNPHSHRGKSASRLVQALLGCTAAEARQITGEGAPPPLPAPDDYLHELQTLMGAQPPEPPKALQLPKEFKPLSGGGQFSALFWDYLELERHYSGYEADWASWRYNLHYATRGRFRYRLIVPIHNRAGKLVNWTGRSIVRDESQRYKTLSRHEYVAAPMEGLLGIEWLANLPHMTALVLGEGPFDAIRVSTLGHHMGIYGTCTFGLNLSDQQLSQLRSLRYDTLAIAWDQGEDLRMLALTSRLVGLRYKRLMLPVKDPGELQSRMGRDYLKQNLY